MKFKSKGQTLLDLQSCLKQAQVLDVYLLKHSDWVATPEGCVDDIFRMLKSKQLIVRSSSQKEDQLFSSMAGHYKSVPNVTRLDLSSAIDDVFQSYGDEIGEFSEVLVQPMLSQCRLSGVAFSWDPNTSGPYIVINYSENINKTDAVTSGGDSQNRACYIHRARQDLAPAPLFPLLALISELENLFNTEQLDIEFAVDHDGQIYLFQVRPLISLVSSERDIEAQIECLKNIGEKFKSLDIAHPYLKGKKTIFGIMPDWNPAEMIGVRPRPLALSLYQELITNAIWAYQRDNYGYRNLRSFPLLYSFGGCPYIDVRVSFNSFVPSDLNDQVAEKLVDYYTHKLLENPSYHDKIEFEIIHSCYTLDLPQRLQHLKLYGFSEPDIEAIASSLRELTNRVLHKEQGLWLKDIQKIHVLNERLDKIHASELNPRDKIYWLLEDCKRYGTLPFAGLARAGFIAVQMLKSMIEVGVISEVEFHSFMENLDTVSSKIQNDFIDFDLPQFLSEYGHLRPGTYDILSKRYDESPETYFSAEKPPKKEPVPPFDLSGLQLEKLNELLQKEGLEIDVSGLFDFIKSAIEGREFAKFIFTKHLSDILLILGGQAKHLGISIEDCSYFNIQDLLSAYTQSTHPQKMFLDSIQRGKQSYHMTQYIHLPPLISHQDHIWCFELEEGKPNFITQSRICAPVIHISSEVKDWAGKIVLIPSADPGFDWLFSHQIAGLITMYGGVNSHMSIRAGELGIPAVIGAGEILFKKWLAARVLDLNCVNKQIQIIQ